MIERVDPHLALLLALLAAKFCATLGVRVRRRQGHIEVREAKPLWSAPHFRRPAVSKRTE